MPLYDLRNRKTGDEFREWMSISEKEQYLIDNPHVEQMFTRGNSVLDPIRLGRQKPDDSFRDILRNIKKKHAHTTVNTF